MHPANFNIHLRDARNALLAASVLLQEEEDEAAGHCVQTANEKLQGLYPVAPEAARKHVLSAQDSAEDAQQLLVEGYMFLEDAPWLIHDAIEQIHLAMELAEKT